MTILTLLSIGAWSGDMTNAQVVSGLRAQALAAGAITLLCIAAVCAAAEYHRRHERARRRAIVVPFRSAERRQ